MFLLHKRGKYFFTLFSKIVLLEFLQFILVRLNMIWAMHNAEVEIFQKIATEHLIH